MQINTERNLNGLVHLVVALHSVDEGLVGHDLRVSAEESLEALFDRLQLLLTDLRRTRTDTRHRDNYSYCNDTFGINQTKQRAFFKTTKTRRKLISA